MATLLDAASPLPLIPTPPPLTSSPPPHSAVDAPQDDEEYRVESGRRGTSRSVESTATTFLMDASSIVGGGMESSHIVNSGFLDVTGAAAAPPTNASYLTPNRSAELSVVRRTELLNKSRERLAAVRRDEADLNGRVAQLEAEAARLESELMARKQAVEDRAYCETHGLTSEAAQAALAAFDLGALQRQVEAQEAESIRYRMALKEAEQASATAWAALQLSLESAAEQWARALRHDQDRVLAERLEASNQVWEPVYLRLREELDALTEAGCTPATLESKLEAIAEQTQSLREALEESERAAAEAQQQCDAGVVELATQRAEFEREAAQRRNRVAFERRVAQDRQAKAQAELHAVEAETKELEAEIARRKDAIRAEELREETAVLEDLIAHYAFERESLRQELALTPSAEDLPKRREALEQQVLRLSTELGELNGDYNAVLEARAMDPAQLADAMNALLAECTTLEAQAAILEAEDRQLLADVHDADEALRLWVAEELPRHIAFEDRLRAEVELLEAELQQVKAAAEEEARRRRKELLDAEEAAAALRQEATLLEGSPEGRAVLAASSPVLGSRHDAANGWLDESSIAFSSPEKMFEVVTPVVTQEGAVTTIVQQRRRPKLAPGESSTVVAPPSTVGPLHDSTTMMTTAGAAAAMASGNNPKDEEDRHFNFLAVSVVKSVLRLFGWAARDPTVMPHASPFSV